MYQIISTGWYQEMGTAIVGKVFIDATYEGDLGAAAGVPYSIGANVKTNIMK